MQVPFYEIRKIFKNTYFEEHLRTTASEHFIPKTLHKCEHQLVFYLSFINLYDLQKPLLVVDPVGSGKIFLVCNFVTSRLFLGQY